MFSNFWNKFSNRTIHIYINLYKGKEEQKMDCDEINKNKKKIVLSDELQESMMKFFLKTSIPRKKRLDKKLLSENEKR